MECSEMSVFKNEFMLNSTWSRQRALSESRTQSAITSDRLDRSAAKWIGLASSEGTKINRRHALRWWLISNGMWTSRNPRLVPPTSRPEYWQKLIPEVDAIVSKIRSGGLDPYSSVNNLIDYMKKRNCWKCTKDAKPGEPRGPTID
jgi:hypothetical protein